MSLLDGPDTLRVFTEVAGTDDDGNPVRVPAASPVVVWGRVQPISAAESAAAERPLSTVYKFTGRDFPGGAYARVEWDGRAWDVLGEPMRRNGSPATRHVSVLLAARSPQAL